jgi:hypothetical protein
MLTPLQVEALNTQLAVLESAARESFGLEGPSYACARCYQLLGIRENESQVLARYTHVAPTSCTTLPWPVDQVAIKLRRLLTDRVELDG